MQKGDRIGAGDRDIVPDPSLGLTTHSTIRSQQRGVPPLVIDLLDRFGARTQGARGAEILYFDRRARSKVLAYAGGLIGKLNEYLDAYAVVADGRLVTVGCRYKRLRQQ